MVAFWRNYRLDINISTATWAWKMRWSSYYISASRQTLADDGAQLYESDRTRHVERTNCVEPCWHTLAWSTARGESELPISQYTLAKVKLG